MKQNTNGNCLSPTAEFFNWLTPSEANECIITLMRITTQSEEYANYSEMRKQDLWFDINLIRAVLFDLSSQNSINEAK